MPISRIPAGVGLLAVLLAGCSSGAAHSPRTVSLPELGFAFPAPDAARDVVYATGEGPEGKPAAYLSTRSLADEGGPSCRAGATGAVSPWPLGQVVVADETPEQVDEEMREDPEEGLGEYLGQVGSRYLYYRAPPQEPCSDDGSAATLQVTQVAAVKQALRQATPLPGSAAPVPAAGAPGRSTPG